MDTKLSNYIKSLPKGPFSYQEALKLGVGQHIVKKLLAQEIIERVSHGVYQPVDQAGGTNEDLYGAATLRCGIPSCVCLLSALEYHHLTDQISKKVWMLVPETKRIKASELKLIRSRNPRWNIGIKKNKGYWITTLERTLIDCLLYKRLVGPQVVLGALKQAVAQKRVKPGRIYDVAKSMGVVHRIRPYMEILAL